MVVDPAQVEPLKIKELHYVELQDLVSLPFPASIKQKVKAAAEQWKQIS